jgi:hypothetical protein
MVGILQRNSKQSSGRERGKQNLFLSIIYRLQ